MRVLLCSGRPGASDRAEALRQEGLFVTTTDLPVPPQALALAAAQQDALLIEFEDLRSGQTGFVRQLRDLGLQLPILVLCPAATPEAERDVCDAGADDSLARNPVAAVIAARLRAAQRRCAGHPVTRLACGNVILEPGRRQVTVEGRPVKLTAREFDVLELLFLRRGALQTKEYLLSRLYGGAAERDGRILDVFICKLRRKLAAAGAVEVIRTVWGHGYLAEAPSMPRRAPSEAAWAVVGETRARLLAGRTA